MLYKLTEVKTYYIEADTVDEAFDKYSELNDAEITVEIVSPDNSG